jgi:hypothetical protein
MSETDKEKTAEDGGDVITMCLKILEALPHDTIALAALCEAYEEADDLENAAKYLVQLGRVILAERDVETAITLVETLRRATTNETPGAERTIRQLTELIANQTAAAPQTETIPHESAKAVDISEELTLAWNLLQAEELTQEEYSTVVQDLSENASRNMDVPTSVLHVLHDRSFKQLQRIVTSLVQATGLPLIALSNFEVPSEASSLLPEEFMTRRGAIAFETMSDDLLVAILNPYATSLMGRISDLTGKRCHFYLTTATDYDTALSTIRGAGSR